jgi:cell division protein FtsN
MDWLKRNWVDVLMAGLILAVVGGLLTLLLRGGVFKPNTNTNTASGSTTPVTTVPAPTSTPKPIQPSSQPSPKPVVTPKPVVAPKPVVTPKPVTTPKPSNKPRTTTPLGVPDIPEAPITTTKPSVSPKPTTITNTEVNTNPIITTNAITTTNRPVINKPIQASQTKITKPIQTPSTPLKTLGTYTRADFLRNYRVAAGSYTNLERAKKAVMQLRARGLPAQTFPSGQTHVVVVGPYARQAAARAALSKVRQTFPDAILYHPDGTKEVSARAATQKTITPQSGGTGQPATLNAESAYLQVGAFKDSKSALALLAKLKNAGFAPLTKTISGLLRVLVGPLQNNQIENTRSELKNQGFEAFQVKL